MSQSGYARLWLAARAEALAAVLVLTVLGCTAAPPPPPPPPPPLLPTPPSTPPSDVERTVPGEKPIQQVMPFFSKPREGQSRCKAWVVVGFTIAPSGAVESPSVIARCPDDDMDSAALDAVSQWRYKPRSAPTTSRVSFDYQTETPCDCPPSAP
jgi:TonB family protein